MTEKGDKVTLKAEIRPRYLAGAIVEVTEPMTEVKYVGMDATPIWRHTGVVKYIDGASPRNAQFYVGGSICFHDNHVEASK